MFYFLACLIVCNPCKNYFGVFKKEVAYVFPLGTFLKVVGAAFIDRKGSKRSAMNAIKETFRELVRTTFLPIIIIRYCNISEIYNS